MLVVYSLSGLGILILTGIISAYSYCKSKQGLVDKLLDSTKPVRRLLPEDEIVNTLRHYIKNVFFRDGYTIFQSHLILEYCVSEMILVLLNKKSQTSDKFLQIGYTNKIKIVLYNYISLYPEIMKTEVIQSVCAKIICSLKEIEEDSFRIFKELIKVFKQDLSILYFLENAIESMYQKEINSPEISHNFIQETNLNLNAFKFDEDKCKRYYSVFKSRV